jgi:hypothetical protein
MLASISNTNPFIFLLLQRSINLANTARNGRASSPPASAVNSTRTKTTLGETRPDRASVDAAGESAVGVEDGVTGLNEVGVAGLAVVRC